MSRKINLFFDALPRFLGAGEKGAMAFIRCLPREFCNSLCVNRERSQDWDIFLVGHMYDREKGLITGDKAVEMRENKGRPCLLLVDTNQAGAGMDGIYSASKELHEEDLFRHLHDLAIKSIKQPDIRAISLKAVKRSRRSIRRKIFSPWKEYEFYCDVADLDMKNAGGAFSSLGIWPVDLSQSKNFEDDVEIAAQMVEKLLSPLVVDKPPTLRIESILLPREEQGKAKIIEDMLRSLPVKGNDNFFNELRNSHELWLNQVHPGFSSADITKIEIQSWYGPSGKLSKWSGLVSGGESADLPTFVLPLLDETDNPVQDNSKKSKLEIRWKTVPAELAKGMVSYEVEIRSGDDQLAVLTVEHTGKDVERAIFHDDDFDAEIIGNGSRFEAKAVVKVIGKELESETPEFTIIRDEKGTAEKTINARTIRCLIDGAIELRKDKFDELLSPDSRKDIRRIFTDKNGRVAFRHGNKSYCANRSKALKEVEEQWIDNPNIVPRWRIWIREDGMWSGRAEILEIEKKAASDKAWDRVIAANKAFSSGLSRDCGMLGRLYKAEDSSADEYVNAWAELLGDNVNFEPTHSLAHTAEVLGLGGQLIGLIVLPSHPLRIAWQMAYESLASYLAYESQIKQNVLKKALADLAPVNVPFFLPGLEPGRSFLFGDTFGMAIAAMVSDNDPEPKNSLSLMATCMEIDEDNTPSIGAKTSSILAKEIISYLELHQDVLGGTLRIHAWRAGDAATVARAMGDAKKEFENLGHPDTNEDTQMIGNQRRFSYDLTLVSDPDATASGRFFSNISRNRRCGLKSIAERDEWMLAVLGFGGNRNRPQLRWRRHDIGKDFNRRDAHLNIVFDSFKSEIQFVKDTNNDSSMNSLFGLVQFPVRSFSVTDGNPEWCFRLPFPGEIKTHPVARKYSERVYKLHQSVVLSLSAHLGHPGEYPCMVTRLLPEKRDNLKSLHKNCDWVVSIDRNAGVEYFDSPMDAPDAYDIYIIDAVPERDDLGSLQMITSTCNADEVRILLDMATAHMGLSNSRRNSEYLFKHLKALSGRLAIRLASPANEERARNSGELLALAMSRANSLQANSDDKTWFSLKTGFFIPVDDIRDILPFAESINEPEEANGDEPPKQGARRADLIYVQMLGKSLCLRMVEIKYRRHLQQARNHSFHEDIVEQLNQSFIGFDKWFSISELIQNPVIIALRRIKLARVLTFYLDKARRHHLPQDKYSSLSIEIKRLLSKPDEYVFSMPEDDLHHAFIFCPEFNAAPEKIYSDETGAVSVHIFGPSMLPDPVLTNIEPIEISDAPLDKTKVQDGSMPIPNLDSQVERLVSAKLKKSTSKSNASIPSAKSDISCQPIETAGQAVIDIGRPLSGFPEKLTFQVSTKGNPHLLIVGLPGMGKTTCLGGICRQLTSQGVTPIVLSFHQDIDNQVSSNVGDILSFECPKIGFNPMLINSDKPLAHIDNCGMLRDIFAAIYPDLGDIQLEELRKSMKDSYEQAGWKKSDSLDAVKPPPFVRFLQILKKQNANKGLLARLEELDNYDFFADNREESSLLELHTPVVLKAHAQQNNVVQNAYASFIIYRLYRDMFRRGPQQHITHAVILDEAHRSSRLKLLPTMAKECRKYGIALILASQEVKDFHSSLFSAVANYLVLRVLDQDAKVIARNLMPSDKERSVRNKLIQLQKYHAMFFSESYRQPCTIELASPASELSK